MENKEIYSSCFAEYYDALYSEKNYKAECDHLQNIFSRHGNVTTILDLGCGTGTHAIELARRGCFAVHGIDLSGELIAQANMKSLNMSQPITFEVADARSYHSTKRYSAVISMFGVISYQLKTEDLIRTFKTVNRHLTAGGLFVFDFWNGPAVIRSERPNGTLREIMVDGRKIYKFTEVVPDGPQNNLADIRFSIFDMEKKIHIQDRHRQRFFFMHEIEDQLTQIGMKIVGIEGGNLGTSLLHAESVNRLPWNVTVIARKEKDNEW
jgi:SAM-dependent methyltransferase